jgi:MFS family permease
VLRRDSQAAGSTLSRTSYAAVLGCAFFCYAALGSVVRILPAYVPARLGAGSVAVGLGVGAPALSAIFMRPLGGRLSDRRGPLPIMLAGAAVMAAGAPLALVANLAPLLASRLLVGAGEGLMMSATALWLLRLGGEERRGRSIGHVGLANYAGLVAGPLLAVAIGGEQHPSRVFLAGIALPLLGAAGVLLGRPGHGGPGEGGARPAPLREVLGWTLRPGLGLMLVNVGYAALISFGAAAIAADGADASSLVVPVFAVVVIAVRGAAGSVPDRFGAERTLIASCPVAAAGLLGVGLLGDTGLVVLALALLAAGQALAVPALGAIALRDVPPSHHGSAAGLFFAWFDAVVGFGGPVAGLAAGLTDASGALVTAAVLVSSAPLLAGTIAARRPAAHRCGEHSSAR